ncbi:MAG: hypothetical protein DRP58_01750 [Spirochaetes bacterium]|nr:MAG: hypothetical protein DRP58_01750 [Spirochaetota bacterium]
MHSRAATKLRPDKLASDQALVAEIVPHRFALPVRLIAEQVRLHSRAATKLRPDKLASDQAFSFVKIFFPIYMFFQR